MEVQFTKGGEPVILVPDDILRGSGFCRAASDGTSLSNGSRRSVNIPITSVFFGALVSLFYVVSNGCN